MASPQLIGVDWGTTSFRAYLIDRDGTVKDRRSSARGITSVTDAAFEPVLAGEIGPWREAYGALPIVMSGMIGSRQGWREAPYATCPAGLPEVAGALLRFESAGLGQVAIVPGLTTLTDGVPDVMRGEETQIFGALAVRGGRDGVFVLPGTHSKRVVVRDGRIAAFATYMTGEVFAALKDHTILGRLMAPAAAEATEAFLAGVAAGAKSGGPGALLRRVFAARTLGLFDRLKGEEIADYLSGLLIGAELGDGETRDAVTIMASDALAGRYERAAAALGIATTRAPADAVVAGHVGIARAAGLIGATT